MTSAQNGNARYSSPYPIGRLAPFSLLPEPLIEELEKKLIPAHPIAGSLIYRQNDKAESIFILLAGRVKITATPVKAKTALLKIARPGELLGLSAAISGRPHFATARAIDDCSLGLLLWKDLDDLMQRHPRLSNAIARYLAMDCTDVSTEVLLLRVPSSNSQKLAAILLRLNELTSVYRSRKLPMPYTHAELGQLIGASRETITRLLQKLQKAEILAINNSSCEILDERLLRQLAATVNT